MESAGSDSVRAWDSGLLWTAAPAADLQRARGVHCVLGGDGTSLLEESPAVGCLVKSPGVSPRQPLVAEAARRGLPILDELELGWRHCTAPVIGVTGTNGKSTVAALIQAVLRSAGVDAQVAGNTVFGPPLSAAARARPEAVVCEVSSFQLDCCPALLPEVALFTNLSRDHIDRHRSMERYFEVKRRLFVREDRCVPVAVVGVDDDHGRSLAADVAARGGRVVSFGRSSAADLRIDTVEWTLEATSVSLQSASGSLTAKAPFPGPVNALNVAAALAFAEAVGLDLSTATHAIAGAPRLPGRFERIPTDQPFDVVVDFAHTPDGVARALEVASGVVARRPRSRRVRVVCGVLSVVGDPEHQAGIGAAAARGDQVVLTTDERRPGESPAVPGTVVAAARAAADGEVEVVPDRREAIRHAVTSAEPGDVVLVLGRGAVTDPLVDGSGAYEPFDDRREAARALAALAG